MTTPRVRASLGKAALRKRQSKLLKRRRANRDEAGYPKEPVLIRKYVKGTCRRVLIAV